MILLAVTFFPGTRFPAYWFNSLLVPGIDRLHAALDFDWKQYLVHQAKYLPLLLLDMLFVPGILSDEEEKNGLSGVDKIALEEGHEEEAASSLQSPSTARSRIVASGLQLRNFSREHGTPAKHSPRKRIAEMSPALPVPVVRTPVTTTGATNRRRRRRRTMNEKVRKVLCGDENIRIRDFLFDLDMPSVPTSNGGAQISPNGEIARGVVVSSANRESDRRQERRDARNCERRRRTFGGAVGRNDFLRLAGEGCKPNERNVVPEGTPNERDLQVEEEANGENNQGTSNSSNITVRRSKRIAKRDKST